MSWTVTFVNRVAEAEVDALPADMQSRFARIVQMIVARGLVAMHEPHVKHLDGKLWEMRLKGRDGMRGRSMWRRAVSVWWCCGLL
jgi:hypothetical protein